MSQDRDQLVHQLSHLIMDWEFRANAHPMAVVQAALMKAVKQLQDVIDGELVLESIPTWTEVQNEAMRKCLLSMAKDCRDLARDMDRYQEDRPLSLILRSTAKRAENIADQEWIGQMVRQQRPSTGHQA